MGINAPFVVYGKMNPILGGDANMPYYTIIAGVNGEGKSSLSGVLKSERNDMGFIVDVDRLGVENNCGSINAGKLAIDKISGFLQNGISLASLAD